MIGGEPLYSSNNQHCLRRVLQRMGPKMKMEGSGGQMVGPREPSIRFPDPGVIPLDELLESSLKSGPLASVQPELRVIGVTDEGTAVVDIMVHDGVVGLVPGLQGTVDSLHEVVHHPTVSGVSDEQDLSRVPRSTITTEQRTQELICHLEKIVAVSVVNVIFRDEVPQSQLLQGWAFCPGQPLSFAILLSRERRNGQSDEERQGRSCGSH